MQNIVECASLGENMSGSGFDSAHYKEGIRREWGVSATAWKDNWPTWERAAQPVNDRLVELARVCPGQRVLDVATGLGEPAFTAARLVGPTGSVLGTDIAPEMIAIAREHAAQLRMENIEFHEMDAEEPDLPAGTFHAVLCRLGLMFLPNLQDALTRLRLLLIPGGRFAAAVWGPRDRSPFSTVTQGTIQEALNTPAPPPGTPGTFRLSDPNLLRRVFAESGYIGALTDSVDIIFEYNSVEEFVHERYTTSASIRAMLANVPEEEQAAIWRRVAKKAAEYTDADGIIRLPAQILCVVGQNP